MTDTRESGTALDPKYDASGLVTGVVTDHRSGEVLMVAHMNAEAIALTRETGIAHFWSRSRQRIWKKGESSGHILNVIEMRIDCDQDAIWLRVDVRGGASCHVGYRSCFYRRVPIGDEAAKGDFKLVFTETEKVFDPEKVYGDAPNPTRL